MATTPQFLGFKCLTDKGRHERCSICPLQSVELCAGLCQYLEKKQAIFLNDDDSQDSSFSYIDKASLLKETLVKLEKGYSHFKGIGSFPGYINGIYKNIKLRHLRRYQEQPVEMQVIMSIFNDPELIVLGGAVEKKQKIRYAFIPKHNKSVSESAASLLVVPSHQTDILDILSEKKNRIILVHGKSKPDTIWIAKVVENGCQVLWFPSDKKNGSVIKNEINNEIRTYVDISSGLGSEHEGDHGERVMDIHDYSWSEQQEAKENIGIEDCLEEMLLLDKQHSCANCVLLYLMTEKTLLNNPSKYPEAFLKKGEIRRDAIYQNMAGTMKKRAEAIQKQYRRCLENEPFSKYLKNCLEGYPPS